MTTPALGWARVYAINTVGLNKAKELLVVRDPLRAIVIGLFLAMCACLLWRPFWSHDTWWHIQCGRLIVQDHIWPSPDRFTCTVNGQPWLVHSWISQCVMYLADRILGDIGLQILDTGTRLLFVFPVWFVTRQSPIPPTIRLLVVANAAFFCATLEYRPHLAVPVFLTCLVFADDLNRPDCPVPLWTVPLMALWSTVHPSILLGEFLLGVSLLRRWFQPAGARSARDLLVLSAALLAGFLNPYHFRLVPFSLFENRGYGQVHINEWLSPLSQLPASSIDLLVLSVNTIIFLWLLARFLKDRSAYQFHDLIYLAGLCVLACAAYIAFRFMFLSTIALLPLLRSFGTRDDPDQQCSLLFRPSIPVALLVVYFLILTVGKPVYSRDWFELKKATAFLKSVHAEGNIFNDFSFGGRIIYDCYPNLKVFADGRIGPFEDKVFGQYREVLEGPEQNALAILDDYRIDWILIQESLQPRWMNETAGFQEMYRYSGIVILKLTGEAN
ncbi:MAG: hypothetical protein ABIH23_36250 [bacterium]